MKILELVQKEHNITVGDTCPYIEPNITEDTLFTVNGEPVGVYIKDISKYSAKAAMLADIADSELRSKRVPKSLMKRSSGFADGNKDKEVLQYSAILGGIPPKPHMRRPYPTVSSVHGVASARPFVKAMLLLAKESEMIVKQLMPEQYEQQVALIAKNAPKKYRFGDMFTSSISNFNIAADFHRDNANLQGCSNVIIAKRMSSKGGNTSVPDYGITVDSADNSMLFYPAWRNVHGVTPIIPTCEGGYRNTLVFYPLKSFSKFTEDD